MIYARIGESFYIARTIYGQDAIIGAGGSLSGSSIVADITTVPDDSTPVTITVTVLLDGVPVPGAIVVLSTDPSGQTGDGQTGITDASGTITFIVSAIIQGQVTYSATANGDLLPGNVTVTYTALNAFNPPGGWQGHEPVYRTKARKEWEDAYPPAQTSTIGD